MLAALALGSTLAGGAPADDRSAEGFLAALQAASDRNDRVAIAASVQYPIRVIVSGWIIPVVDRAAFIQSFDAFFTEEIKDLIAEAVTTHRLVKPAAFTGTLAAGEHERYLVRDAVKAQRVTRQLVDLVAATAAAQAASPLQFETIRAPNLPTAPSGPSRATLALSCGAAGLLLGSLAAWFRQRSLDQTTSA